MSTLGPILSASLDTMVSALKGLWQRTIQVNTFKEIIDCSSNIHYNYKRTQNIVQLVALLLTAAGGTALCVAEPHIASGLESLINQQYPVALTFCKIGVAFIGFWLGGACGFSTAKYASEEFTMQRNKFRNAGLDFNDNDVKNIIKKRSDIYAEEEGVALNDSDVDANDVEELKNFLIYIRDQTEKFRNVDPLKKKIYKYSFLEALKKFNITPLVELIVSSVAVSEVRENLSKFFAQHMAELPDNFFKGDPNATSVKVITDEKTQNENTPIKAIEDDQIKLKDTSVPTHLEKTPKTGGLDVPLSNKVKQAKIGKENKAISDAEKKAILYNLQKNYLQNKAAQQELMEKIPQKFLKLLPSRFRV